MKKPSVETADLVALASKATLDRLREEAEKSVTNYGKEIFIYKEGERE